MKYNTKTCQKYYIKACKLNGSLEIVTKPYERSLSLLTIVVFPPNFLDSDVSICSVHQVHASTIKAPILSHLVKAHTYITNKWCEFWCPHFLGPQGLAV